MRRVRNPKPGLNSGKPWSDLDECDLKADLNSGRSIKQIAEFLGRSEAEIEKRMAELDLAVRFFVRGR